MLTLLIGMVVALLRMSQSISGRLLAVAYLEIIRNTPLLVQVSIFYFVLQPLLGFNNPLWAGIICLSVFEGAFASEVIRAGIASVARGQWEASASVGLGRAQTYRYVILPQAIQRVIPPLAGQFITLIKDSSLVALISIQELSFLAMEIAISD